MSSEGTRTEVAVKHADTVIVNMLPTGELEGRYILDRINHVCHFVELVQKISKLGRGTSDIPWHAKPMQATDTLAG